VFELRANVWYDMVVVWYGNNGICMYEYMSSRLKKYIIYMNVRYYMIPTITH